MKVIVLGAGLVGAPMAFDLANGSEFEVTVADISRKNLDKFTGHNIATVEVDLDNETALLEVLKNHDLVLNAVPGFMGYRTTERILRAGKNVVDISFFPEDALTLDGLAKANGIEIVERKIMPEEMADAEECFLTGTAAEVTPVQSIGDYKFTPGEICLKLTDAYNKLVNEK